MISDHHTVTISYGRLRFSPPRLACRARQSRKSLWSMTAA